MKLVIEAASERGANLYFPPLMKTIRGRFDAQRMAARNPDAAKLLNQWPKPVPGQRIELDTASGVGRIVEPVRLDEFRDVRELFDKRAIAVPEDETHEHVHVPSWLHCMKDAVDAGLAEVVEGKFPAKIDGKRLKSFITPDEPDENETLRASLAANTAAMKDAVEAIRDLAESIAGWKD